MLLSAIFCLFSDIFLMAETIGKFNPHTLLQIAIKSASDDELLGQFFTRHISTFKIDIFRELRKRGIRTSQRTMFINFRHLEHRKLWPVDVLAILFDNDPGCTSLSFKKLINELGHQSSRPYRLVIIGEWREDIQGYKLKKIKKTNSNDRLLCFKRCKVRTHSDIHVSSLLLCLFCTNSNQIDTACSLTICRIYFVIKTIIYFLFLNHEKKSLI